MILTNVASYIGFRISRITGLLLISGGLIILIIGTDLSRQIAGWEVQLFKAGPLRIDTIAVYSSNSVVMGCTFFV